MKRKEALKKVFQRYLDAKGGPNEERALDEVIKEYYYLVSNTVSRFTIPHGVEVGDLEAAGHQGLWKAATHYDPEGKAAFITYAIATIRRSILRAIRDASWSKTSADHENKINKARNALFQKLGRMPTITELADYMSVSEERVTAMINASSNNRPLYILQDKDDGSGTQLVDIIPSGDKSHYDRMLLKSQAATLIKLTERLGGSLRDAALLLMQDYSVKEIAKILGVGPSRAGMIVATARERLHDMVIRTGNGDLFAEWLVPVAPGVRPGRLRRRRRRPRMALCLA